ncbi:MAG: class I SAM-dependent methyltransferase [Syntrophaceae bacterium]
MKEILNAQRQHWQNTFVQNPDMFGTEPSDPAQFAVELFKRESKTRILELGGGQGRDTIYFARRGFHVHMLDYSEAAVRTVIDKVQKLELSGSITAQQYDVRDQLPFDVGTFDACYSHMLYCMAFTTSELEFLSYEVRRVLQSNGLHIYTVRNTEDAHYRKGVSQGEDMYEINGFIVHFFSREKIEYLAKGFEIISVDEFEEGDLPRKLFQVTLRKR